MPPPPVEVFPAQVAPTPTLQLRPDELSLATSPPDLTLSSTVSSTTTATIIPVAPVEAQQTPIMIVPRTASAQNNQQRWRAEQIDRQVLNPPQFYVATKPTEVYWFDPVTGQSIVVGRIVGAFPAQASFTFRPSNTPALEIPYKIGQDLGLTALSPALTERLRVAGYMTYAEVYVLKDASVELRR